MHQDKRQEDIHEYQENYHRHMISKRDHEIVARRLLDQDPVIFAHEMHL